jgi:GNAT superfamily N-acetyltransferase
MVKTMSDSPTVTPDEIRGEFTISNDPARIDAGAVHDYLCNHSYWAPGIPREIVERSLRNSLCFGLYHGERQIGLARVVTDLATYAYLCDVYILEAYRGRGLSKWLMATVLKHPDMQGLRRISLATRDAHGLYEKFGFSVSPRPGNVMEIRTPDIYRQHE